MPLKCAVLCAAAIPKPYEPLLHRLRDAPDGGKVLFPTLHTLCRADPMNPSSMGEDVASCFEPLAEVMWHEDGHAIPPLAAASADATGASSTSMADVAAWMLRNTLSPRQCYGCLHALSRQPLRCIVYARPWAYP